MTAIAEKTETSARAVVDIAAIAALVSADLAARFGVKVGEEPVRTARYDETHTCTLETEQKHGVFRMVIESTTVELQAAPVSDGTIWVRGSLNWEHAHGGRNGSTIGTWWVRDGRLENFRAG